MRKRQDIDDSILGVVADFHQKSLKNVIEPLLLLPTLQGNYSQFSLKIDQRHLSATFDTIQKAYADYFTGNVFNYYFLDEKFNRQYSNDYLFGKVFGLWPIVEEHRYFNQWLRVIKNYKCASIKVLMILYPNRMFASNLNKCKSHNFILWKINQPGSRRCWMA